MQQMDELVINLKLKTIELSSKETSSWESIPVLPYIFGIAIFLMIIFMGNCLMESDLSTVFVFERHEAQEIETAKNMINQVRHNIKI